MHHSSFAPRLLAMSLLAASALSVSAFAAPVSSSTAIRVDRDPTTNASSSVTASTDSPVTVDPSQASGQIKVVYQDANGVERTATIAAVAAQAENYARVTTNGDTLRVRQGPGTNYGILCSVEDGDTFPITGKTNGWYQILCNGRTGYVSAQYAKVEDSDQVSKPDPDDNAATNPEGNSIVAAALQYVGYPYVYGTAGPETFDCSGFTSYIYKQFGVTLNRSSKDQVNNGRGRLQIQLAAGRPGLLLHQRRLPHPRGHLHRRWQHRPRSTAKDGVKISSLNTSYYTTNYFAARRIV